MVSSGGVSNHLHLIFEINKKDMKSTTPLKFNHIWLLKEDYKNMVEDIWEPLRSHNPSSFMQHFVDNIAKVKYKTKAWSISFKEKCQAHLKET